MGRYKKVPKNWGSETWIVNNEKYCLKIFEVNKDEWTSNGLYHYHKLKTETFYILNGELFLETVYNGVIDKVVLKPGDSYTINPYIGHRFTAHTDICNCIEVSTQHFDSDSYRVKFEDLPQGVVYES